jgi:hypothetical protein
MCYDPAPVPEKETTAVPPQSVPDGSVKMIEVKNA